MASRLHIPIPATRYYHPIEKLEFIHEYDAHGWHRLVVEGRVGVWVSFSDLALIKIDGATYAASTDKWCGAIPEIFRILAIKYYEPFEES